MKIKLSETFFIEQCLHAPFNWDLIKVTYGNRRGEENVRIETAVAYGLSLNQLVTKVADYEIFENERSFAEFKTYIDQYKEISKQTVEEIIKQLKK